LCSHALRHPAARSFASTQRSPPPAPRARAAADLEKIYDEVESLEKTKVVKTSVRKTTELFFWFLNAAFCFLLLEMSLRWGPLRVITV
jgi:hypothetical protein